MRWLTADYRGHPRWMLGINARAHRRWWLLAAVAVPVACWTLALTLIPYGESIDEMRPVGSGLALLAAPFITLLAASRRSDRAALTRATVLAMGCIACALVGLSIVAFCGFFLYVALAWPSG